MAISRYKKLLALSALICALPTQSAFEDIPELSKWIIESPEEFVFRSREISIPTLTQVAQILLVPLSIIMAEKVASKIIDIARLKFDKNYRQKNLIVALLKRSSRRIEKVIKSGPDLNHVYNSWSGDLWSYSFTNKAGWTPLTWALSNKNDKKTIDMLLYHGADPNINNGYGHSPLLIAALNNSLSVVKTLLDHGANPNLINMNKAKISDDMKQFLDYHAYNYHPDYKEAIREGAQSNGLSENAELTIVSFLYGQQAAKDEAQKRIRCRSERFSLLYEVRGLE